MKIACISLGCPKNQVDLDVMVHILLSAGHETVADLAEADVILVNTCGFIESAKTEAIENILEACSYKQANPNLKVPGLLHWVCGASRRAPADEAMIHPFLPGVKYAQCGNLVTGALFSCMTGVIHASSPGSLSGYKL